MSGDGRPKAHRFRSYWPELGKRLREFRQQRGLNQAEVARGVGASTPTTVIRWESGEAVPDGIRRDGWSICSMGGYGAIYGKPA